MDEIHSSAGLSRGPRIGDEKQGEGEREPRASSEVADDAVAVGKAEVVERRRRHDVDLDACPLEVVDRVLDEHPGDVSVEARVGGRQDEDLHPAGAGGALRPKTTGTATASVAKT